MAVTNLDSHVLSRSAVELRNVTRVYGSSGTQVVALDDVTVEFPSGSWTVVMGPSGSGKSTLRTALVASKRLLVGRCW